MSFDLSNDNMPPHYWRALKSFLTAFSYGEPISKHSGVGQKSADWLFKRGLLETVVNPQYRGERCYRVSALGHATLKRGSRARQHDRRLRPAMIQSRIAILKPRVKLLDEM